MFFHLTLFEASKYQNLPICHFQKLLSFAIFLIFRICQREITIYSLFESPCSLEKKCLFPTYFWGFFKISPGANNPEEFLFNKQHIVHCVFNTEENSVHFLCEEEKSQEGSDKTCEGKSGHRDGVTKPGGRW